MQRKTILFDLNHNEMLNLGEEFSDLLKILQYLDLKIKKNEDKDVTKKILEEVDVLILGNPIDDYFSNIEIKDIVNFVRSGGNLMLVSEYGADYLQKTNLNDLASNFGIIFEKNLIKEQNSHHQNCSSILHIQQFPTHDIVSGLREVIIGGACSLFLKKGAKALLQTNKENIWSEVYSSNSEEWVKSREEQHTLAAYTNFGRGKVVAIGDIDIFCSDDNIGINSLDNNKFLRNAINWLIEPIKRPEVMSFILDQLGDLQSGVKEIQNTINNIIETISILETRISYLEKKKVK
jgi:hypothetical protein